MIEFWRADLRDCPPSVVLCRVAYRLIVRGYRLNPLHFANPAEGIDRVDAWLEREGFRALSLTCHQAATYKRIHNRKLELWRFDVSRCAGKAILRSRDRRLTASERAYPPISNTGVGTSIGWLTDLPNDLPDVRTTEGRARL
jgi:hypothetical protein